MEAEHCKQEPLSAAPMYPPETHITDAGEALMHGLTTKGTGNTRDEHCMDWQARLYRKRARESATLSLLEAIDGECEEMELSLRQSLTMLSVGSPSKLSSRPDSAGNRSVRCRTSLALLDIVGEPSTDYLTPPALGMPMAAVNHVIGAVAPEGAEQEGPAASDDKVKGPGLPSRPTLGFASGSKESIVTLQQPNPEQPRRKTRGGALLTSKAAKAALLDLSDPEVLTMHMENAIRQTLQMGREKGVDISSVLSRINGLPDAPLNDLMPSQQSAGLLTLMPQSRSSRMGLRIDTTADPRDSTATMASGPMTHLMRESLAPDAACAAIWRDRNIPQQRDSESMASAKHNTCNANARADEPHGLPVGSMFPSHNMADARVSWLNFSFPASRISQGAGSLGMPQHMQRTSITLDLGVPQSHVPRRCSTRFNSLSQMLDLITSSQDINHDSARHAHIADEQLGSDMDGYGLPRISSAQLPGRLLASGQDLLPLTADYTLRRSLTILSDSGVALQRPSSTILDQPGSSCLLPPYQMSRQSQACLAQMMLAFDSSDKLEVDDLQSRTVVPDQQRAFQKAADSGIATVADPGTHQIQENTSTDMAAVHQSTQPEVVGHHEVPSVSGCTLANETQLGGKAHDDPTVDELPRGEPGLMPLGPKQEEGATDDGEEEVLNVAGASDITKSILVTLYHLPINEAAKALGLGVTVFKKACRHFNITKWPYRKLASLDKLIETVQIDATDCPEIAATAASLLARLDTCKKEIYKDVETTLPSDIKRLRQANFKNEYKYRVKQAKHPQH